MITKLPSGGIAVGVSDDLEGEEWRRPLMTVYMDRIRAKARVRASVQRSDPWTTVARAMRDAQWADLADPELWKF